MSIFDRLLRHRRLAVETAFLAGVGVITTALAQVAFAFG
jgi:hypothetical protein